MGGYEDNERDYTATELAAIGDELMETRSAIIQYLATFDRENFPT
jgi:hypothetical protein